MMRKSWTTSHKREAKLTLYQAIYNNEHSSKALHQMSKNNGINHNNKYCQTQNLLGINRSRNSERVPNGQNRTIGYQMQNNINQHNLSRIMKPPRPKVIVHKGRMNKSSSNHLEKVGLRRNSANKEKSNYLMMTMKNNRNYFCPNFIHEATFENSNNLNMSKTSTFEGKAKKYFLTGSRTTTSISTRTSLENRQRLFSPKSSSSYKQPATTYFSVETRRKTPIHCPIQSKKGLKVMLQVARTYTPSPKLGLSFEKQGRNILSPEAKREEKRGVFVRGVMSIGRRRYLDDDKENG